MMPVSHRATGAYNTAIPAVPGGGFQAGAAPATTTGGSGNGNGSGTATNVSGANAASNTSGTAGVGATNATANSVSNPLLTSSSDSHNGVELNTLRSVPATTSTTTSSSHNNNNQSSSARSNMTYSRLNSSSMHGDVDGDEERGSGAVV